MIPDLPPGVSDSDQIAFYNTLWGNLSDQSSVHVNWHTHRQNPSVCWICDLYNLTAKILYMYDRLLTKSSLDNMTELSSVKVSDSEIESDSNSIQEFDEDGMPINEPEYDVVDDLDSDQ